MTRQQRQILVIAILASFVAFLDGSVTNVALPAMVAELGGGLGTQQWIVDAYLITLGSLILLAGSLSDVFGRISVLRFGLIGFGITSVAIALSPTPEFVIVARALQGVAGALLVPSSLALIISAFRDAAQAKAIGIWTAWTGAAFLAGPFLGGLAADYVTWRLVFGINVIPILVTLWMLTRLDKSVDSRSGGRIDVLGAVLGFLGLGGPVFALIEQGNYGWGSPVVFLPLVLGLLSFAGFLFWQARAPQPMLPLGLFRIRNFWAGNIATVFIYAALSLGGFVLAIYLQQVAGFSATFAALATLPTSIANVALSSWFGSLSGRFGPRLFMTVGPILAGVGTLMYSGLGSEVNYWTQVLPGVVVFSLGLSMTVAPLTSAILGSVPTTQSGIGSATNNAISRVAGLVAIAMIGVIAGGTIDVDSFQPLMFVTAGLLFAGALSSWLGVRNPKPEAVTAAS
ncbi:EmrB/QacA subfamily drug resistance transporter [Pseudoclavibacter sp. JAI123]|uniref:MFS transporter n=1 Tax=Pseudoclavibacter sp. JAI123 TaxID=2723065 RepID=UPI0015CA384F|nr:MFS transporter [Pseudoclavibacter sp. JAI123]NYF14418.1 EmrB/QacA subfamily drug resistance transporter [Pseudoclavibacter sp. JAI123]